MAPKKRHDIYDVRDIHDIFVYYYDVFIEIITAPHFETNRCIWWP